MQTELNYDTIFDAQEHFRLLLDSMSRPGKINTFPKSDIQPPQGLTQASALVAFALLNADVTYHIAGSNRENIASYVLVNTASVPVEISKADYIFLPGNIDAEGLENARVATAIYPEDSATLVAGVEAVSTLPIDGAISVTLKGPGVNGEATIFIKGIHQRLLAFIQQQNSEYPIGIDLIVTDARNNVIGIPRSSKFTYSLSTN